MTVNECGHPLLPHRSRGMCKNCYERWMYHNLPAVKAAAKLRDRARQLRMKRNHCPDCGIACTGIRCRACAARHTARMVSVPFCSQCRLLHVSAEGQLCRICASGGRRPGVATGRCLKQDCTRKESAHGHCKDCTIVVKVGTSVCAECLVARHRQALRDASPTGGSPPSPPPGSLGFQPVPVVTDGDPDRDQIPGQ